MKHQKQHKKNYKAKENNRIKAYKTLYKGEFPESVPFKHRSMCSIEMSFFIFYLILNSGEIPTDIYNMFNCPPGSFRSVISDLYHDKLIRRNFDNHLHTYLLSAKGKKHFNSYCPPYILTSNVLSSRQRHIRLARLNTFLEGLGVSAFLNHNPDAEDIAIRPELQSRLYFYNAYYLKQNVKYNEKIRRSKAFGVLTGYNKSFAVYYEPIARDYYFEEHLFKETVGNYIGDQINNMLLVVDNQRQAAVWLRLLFKYSQFFTGEKLTDYYENAYILVMDSSARDSLKVIYNERGLARRIALDNDFDDWNDKLLSCKFEGEKCRFVLSLHIRNVIYLMAHSEYQADSHFRIVTTPYLKPFFDVLFKGKNVSVYYIGDEKWKEYLLQSKTI